MGPSAAQNNVIDTTRIYSDARASAIIPKGMTRIELLEITAR